MKFLAVFVTLAAVAFGYPAHTTWTLNELSNALQSPGTDPALIPYLEAALNEMMNALHHGHDMETITIAMPILAQYNLQEVSELLKDPKTPASHIPYLEAALDKLMDAVFAGEENPVATVVLPPVEPGFVDVWPVQVPEDEPSFVDVWPVQTPEEEPSFIDVWPVQTPEEEPSFIDVWPVQTPEAVAPSSPLVQIIVNVQKTSDVGSVVGPSPVEVVDAAPEWGHFN